MSNDHMDKKNGFQMILICSKSYQYLDGKKTRKSHNSQTREARPSGPKDQPIFSPIYYK